MATAQSVAMCAVMLIWFTSQVSQANPFKRQAIVELDVHETSDRAKPRIDPNPYNYPKSGHNRDISSVIKAIVERLVKKRDIEDATGNGGLAHVDAAAAAVLVDKRELDTRDINDEFKTAMLKIKQKNRIRVGAGGSSGSRTVSGDGITCRKVRVYNNQTEEATNNTASGNDTDYEYDYVDCEYEDGMTESQKKIMIVIAVIVGGIVLAFCTIYGGVQAYKRGLCRHFTRDSSSSTPANQRKTATTTKSEDVERSRSRRKQKPQSDNDISENTTESTISEDVTSKI